MLDCYKGYFNLIDINGKSEKAVQDDIIVKMHENNINFSIN